ncbi:DNA cytosine methyltransferase [Acidicapsa dinghuensis]|uniref:Cytosine-specific methyltransferase n=1 Tax=Acidicapsa dinghuensis TaxID=2218256 RepID=A0ABW1ELH1_9BACT|nr:DNA cytosine methyltransferase [Acidicapsa dinghuensis]
MKSSLTTLELCAGAGGEALGLEQAGIEHAGLIEIDPHACKTLRYNRPHWNVMQGDLRAFTDMSSFKGVDIVSGGLPCPPFSKAGKQLGDQDERNLFPVAIDIIDQIRPRAVMIENVRGILDAVFADYRTYIAGSLKKLGYKPDWRLLNSSEFGVPQLRPRVVFVAIQNDHADSFSWPKPFVERPKTAGETLYDLMAANGWKGVKAWKERADEIAPTIVGGSTKHGGPDLGPTRAKRAWAQLGVNAHTIAEEAPDKDFVGMPRLTVRMVARLQGFPDGWIFSGRKTNAYRQVGNAFPPPVACAVAAQIVKSLITRRLFQVAI